MKTSVAEAAQTSVWTVALMICERRLTGWLGVRYVCFCPHCLKVLGFSHRQGYLMSPWI